MSGSQDTKAKAPADDTSATKEQQQLPQKPAAKLEEDDEFEDFPAEGTSRTSLQLGPPRNVNGDW
jgi:hypothetical protein